MCSFRSRWENDRTKSVSVRFPIAAKYISDLSPPSSRGKEHLYTSQRLLIIQSRNNSAGIAGKRSVGHVRFATAGALNAKRPIIATSRPSTTEHLESTLGKKLSVTFSWSYETCSISSSSITCYPDFCSMVMSLGFSLDTRKCSSTQLHQDLSFEKQISGVAATGREPKKCLAELSKGDVLVVSEINGRF